mmetsp:Transcript_34315/g.79206  ORF Transcript_34315/g.79206 Transcript_34315/m.79206 type:complete len:123 (-) Transcript_34315:32-400(-)
MKPPVPTTQEESNVPNEPETPFVEEEKPPIQPGAIHVGRSNDDVVSATNSVFATGQQHQITSQTHDDPDSMTEADTRPMCPQTNTTSGLVARLANPVRGPCKPIVPNTTSKNDCPRSRENLT